jgi:tRNA (guanine37-N1)-methyltransferase
VRFDVISVFPGVFQPVFSVGVVGRAIERGLVDVRAHDLRDFAGDRHRQVDDVPYGGGPGMVMKPEPLFRAIDAVRAENPGPVVLLEPWGRRLDQAFVRELAAEPGLVLVCGRYEGIDDRVRQARADLELSIGDYVLSGGEIAAMVVIDAVARLLPDVVGDPGSLTSDSFAAGLVGHPQYTRPPEFGGLRVPEVLLSGNHQQIEAWRREQAERRTGARGAPQGLKKR